MCVLITVSGYSCVDVGILMVGSQAHQAAEAKATHVYSLEALLSGLLRQKLSLKDNILWRNPAALAEGKGKGGKAAGVQAEAGPARASRRAK